MCMLDAGIRSFTPVFLSLLHPSVTGNPKIRNPESGIRNPESGITVQYRE